MLDTNLRLLELVRHTLELYSQVLLAQPIIGAIEQFSWTKEPSQRKKNLFNCLSLIISNLLAKNLKVVSNKLKFLSYKPKFVSNKLKFVSNKLKFLFNKLRPCV